MLSVVVGILILLLVLLAPLLVLFQLLLPHRVDLFRVEVREHKLEDIAVPIHRVAFDTLFDVLHCVSTLIVILENILSYLW